MVGTSAAVPTTPRRSAVRRILVIATFGVSLYIVLPSLLSLWGDLPRLGRVAPGWFVAVFVAEAMCFWCLWQLQRAALDTHETFAVACSQLAGNALSHTLPGGAAAGGLLQRRMLLRTGQDSAQLTTALAAAGLLAMATLFALPLLALPAALTGEAVVPPLVKGALLGAAVFVVLVVASTVFLTVDRIVIVLVRTAAKVQNRVRKHHATDPDELVDRVIESRDLVRKTLTGSWRRAVPAAVGNQLFDVLALYLSLFAVGADPRFSLTLLAFVGAAAVGMLPFTPGGLGFVEAGLTGLLVLSGVDAGAAALATLLYRIFSYWLPLPIGAAANVAFSRRYPPTP